MLHQLLGFIQHIEKEPLRLGFDQRIESGDGGLGTHELMKSLAHAAPTTSVRCHRKYVCVSDPMQTVRSPTIGVCSAWTKLR